jgi:LysM repeat protein
MGKEYRIGIVAGLLMLVVGVGVVLLNQGPKDADPVVPPAPAKKAVAILGTSNDLTTAPVTSPGDYDPTAPIAGAEPFGGTAPIGGMSPTGGTAPVTGADLGDPTADLASTRPAGGTTKPSDPTFFDPDNVDPYQPSVAPVDPPDVTDLVDPTADVKGRIDPTADVITRPDDTFTIDPNPQVNISTPKTHTVKSGDSYWTLAEKYLGHGKHHLLIKDANPGVNPSNLRLGAVLKIPAKPTTTLRPTTGATTAGFTATSTDGSKRYTVAKGDTMGAIAQKFYGSVRYTYLIQKANPSVEPKRMRPGKTVLRIPPRPATSTRPTTSTTTSPRRSSRPATTVRRNPDEPWFGNQ